MVDLPGHGHSLAPPEPACYTMEHTVAELLGLLDQLALAPVDLLGYSMGGRVALHLALAAPERVRSLILESSSPGLEDENERAARATADEALATRIEREGLAWFVDYWAAIPLFASQAHLPTAVRARLRAQRMRGSAKGYAGSLRGMSVGRQANLWPKLPRLATPTLVINGTLDTKYMAIGARMATLQPHARQISVTGAGHTVHLEQPERFGELMVGWLAKQGAMEQPLSESKDHHDADCMDAHSRL